MPYFIKRGLVTDPSVDGSQRIIGVDNGQPASEIQPTMCVDAQNRLSDLDAINRGRPGITNLVAVTGTASPKVITYFGGGLYLVSDGATLWTLTSNGLLTSVATALPFAPVLGTSPLNCAKANVAAYFTSGAGLYKWNGSAFSTITLPTGIAPYTGVSFPVWYTDRMILALTGSNSLIWSDILNPENYGPSNVATTVTTTLDAEPSDAITGQAGYQVGVLIAFKKAKIYSIYCPPTSAVTAFQVQTISNVIGCAEHNTIAQVGNDLFFLSESGYGIYKLSVLYTTALQPNIGIGAKVSLPIKQYISRINWQAINQARAATWQDLYLLAVPLDGSSVNNALLVYSNDLQAWQGIWYFNTVAGVSRGPTCFGINPSSAAGGSEFMIGFSDLNIANMPRPDALQYNDVDIGGAVINVQSQFTTKGFRFGATMNRILPYSLLVNFFMSTGPVQIDGLTDQRAINSMATVQSAAAQLNLPCNLPCSLGSGGMFPVRANALKLGACRQVQYRLSGINQWTVMDLHADGFETTPVATQ